MSECIADSERAEQLDEIIRLCTHIETAVQNAEWDAVGQLLSCRQQLLESVFAEPAATTAEAEELTSVAARVMAFDRDLMPVADAARGEAAVELKKLRRGRVAAKAYGQISG